MPAARRTTGIAGEIILGRLTLWPPRPDSIGWQVADQAGWLPGIYDSEATAIRAARWANRAAPNTNTLQALSNRVCFVPESGGEGRTITAADLDSIT